MNETSIGMKENVVSGLCYLFGWFSGLIFLLIEQNNREVRFHAWQSILVFGSLSILGVIAGWLPILNGLLTPLVSIATVVLWIVLMIKAFQGQRLSLPIVGPIAEDWANRKRAD